MAEIRRIRRRFDEHFVPDRERTRRLGFDEAILCDSKTEDQLRAIVDDADDRGVTLLLTRLDPATAALLAAAYPDKLGYERLSRTAYFGTIGEPRGAARVVAVSAGTSDVPVCREAVRTLEGLSALACQVGGFDPHVLLREAPSESCHGGVRKDSIGMKPRQAGQQPVGVHR